jgi:transposase
MLHAGLDLSRKKLDICLLSDEGEHLDQLAVAPDVDSLRRLARRIDEVHAEPVSAVVESMTGARIVHDTLEAEGWSVEIADAQKVKGRRLLERLEVPEPWRSNVTASVWLIDELERQIDEINRRLRAGHADHPYVPLLLSVPGIGSVLAFTIAAEIGEIERFSSPERFVGYTGLCPTVKQSGDSDRRGPLSKHGPRYLRWALIEATSHALRHPAYAERYQRNKKRLGKQRGARVAQIDIARRLAHAIWHMLTRNQKFAPRGATFRLAA